MAEMIVSMSDTLRDWAESQVAAGAYESTSAYLGDLVRRDQARAGLQAALDEGRAPGVSERDPFVQPDEPRADAADERGALVAALQRLWAQGEASGAPVEGNFDAAEIARRNADRLEALRAGA